MIISIIIINLLSFFSYLFCHWYIEYIEALTTLTFSRMDLVVLSFNTYYCILS